MESEEFSRQVKLCCLHFFESTPNIYYPVKASKYFYMAIKKNKKRTPIVTNQTFYKLFQVFERLRELDPERLTVSRMSLLMWVAAHDGCSQEDISEPLSMSGSSVSRNLQAIGPRNRQGGSGYNLIDHVPDPSPGKSKHKKVSFVRKGKMLLNGIENIMKSDEKEPRQYDKGYQFYADGRADPKDGDDDFLEFVDWVKARNSNG